MGIKIRNGQKEDLAQICEIYNYYVQNSIATFDLTAQKDTDFEFLVKNRSDRHPFFVASDDHEVLGYCYAGRLKQREAYDLSVEISIYLKYECQGKGIGKKLYSHLISELSKSDVHAVIGGISLPNEVSIKLHENLGFEKVAHFREVGYKFNQWIDVGYWELIFDNKKV